LEMTKTLRPDVVVLDVGMPGLSGLEVIGLLKESLPSVQVVVLSMHAKESYVHQALVSGALGYVLKASPSTDILEAIRAAHRGEYFLSSKIRADVIGSYVRSRKKAPAPKGYELLTEREQQVFRLVVEGNTTARIADILCVSAKTVEKHRTSFMNKLGIHDRLELLKYAIKIGIVDPELWEE
ncbi:MAG: response regulator transcription factor, partial [Syntrophales bacterium]|nr:response regulator transcription factor [Syntrophales bacterium]